MADKTPDTASPPAGAARADGKVRNAQGKWVFARGNRLGRTRKGIPNKTTKEVKEFAREFLSSPKYRASVRKRILAGEAQHLEILLHHYGWGKPADTLKIPGDRPPFLLVLGPRRDPLAEPDEPLALPPGQEA